MSNIETGRSLPARRVLLSGNRVIPVSITGSMITVRCGRFGRYSDIHGLLLAASETRLTSLKITELCGKSQTRKIQERILKNQKPTTFFFGNV